LQALPRVRPGRRAARDLPGYGQQRLGRRGLTNRTRPSATQDRIAIEPPGSPTVRGRAPPGNVAPLARYSPELFSAMDCLLPPPARHRSSLRPTDACRDEPSELSRPTCVRRRGGCCELELFARRASSSSSPRSSQPERRMAVASPCPRRRRHGQGLAMRSSASTLIRAAPEARPPMRLYVPLSAGRWGTPDRPPTLSSHPVTHPPQVAEVQVAHCFARCFARLRLTAADSIARRCLEPLPKRHRDLSP